MSGFFYLAGPDWSAQILTDAEALTGFSKEEINALPNKWLSVVHPDDREKLVQTVAHQLAQRGINQAVYRIETKEGLVRWVADYRRFLYDERQRNVGLEGLVIDITEEVARDHALTKSEQRYRTAVETSMDGYWLTNTDGDLLEVNAAYCAMSGYTRDELLKLRINDLEAKETPEDIAEHLQTLIREGHSRFETQHRRKNGSTFRVEINTVLAPGNSHCYVFLRDIEFRNRADALNTARLRLTQQGLHGAIDDLLQITLDTAEQFTDSQIGFFHFVDPDQEHLFLQNWSTNTLKNMCTAEGHGQHYPVSEAGVWTDCIRERRPVIHNDYASLPHKKGLPEGHAPVIRELTVPIFRNDQIVAVMGLGNKHINYEDSDIALVKELGDLTMEFVERRRADVELRRAEENLRLAQKVAHIGSWQLDLQNGVLWWSEETYAIFGVKPDKPLDYPSFLACLPDDAERARVDTAWQLALKGRKYQVEHRILTPEGKTKWVEERATFNFDEQHRPISALGTVQDITARKKAESEIVQLSHYDGLTGLPNRHLFNLRVRHTLQRNERRESRCALMMIDLDFFKRVNDGFGHEVGDQLLICVADLIKSRLRDEDTLARLGGDEFAILIDELDDPKDAAILARDLIDALSAPITLAGVGDVPIGASIGITVFPDDAVDASALLRNADAAVYQAKSDGRNTFRYYTESLTRSAQERIAMEARLRKAIASGHLVLHYQPLIDAQHQVMGAEALVRWNDPQEGLIPPGRFIPVAEDSGLIAPLGEWVLHTACRQMKQWLDEGRPLKTMAVNISPRQFGLQNVPALVEQALQASGLDPRYLELEITESTLMAQTEAATPVLDRLKALNIRLSIDDFGTGYSSLSYLKRMPIDKLKIDQSFVRDIHVDPNDAAITKAVIAMARALNLTVLAEGVETKEQLAFLETQGCDYYQGFLFSRPVPAESFPHQIVR